MEETYYATDMTDEKRKLVKVVSIVVVLVLLAAIAWWIADRASESNEADAGTTYSKTLPVLSTESREKIPYGFPPYLVLGVKTQVISGNLVEDGAAKTAVRTVKLYSESFADDVAEEYREFFEGAGWMVTSDNSAGDVSTLVANRGDESLAVTITSSGRGAMATLTYTTPIR